MLSESVVKIAANLSDILHSRKIKLQSKRGSPLNDIDNTLVKNLFLPQTEESYDKIAFLTELSKGTFSTGSKSEYIESEHDILIDSLTDKLTEAVVNQISFTRTVVKTEMKVFLDELTSYYTDFKHRDAEDLFDINYISLDPIFKSDYLLEQISNYNKTTPYLNTHLNLSFLENTPFSLKEFLKTGISEYDNIISQFIDAHGEPTLLYYTQKAEEVESQLPLYLKLPFFLINFLFYNAIVQKDGIEGVSNLARSLVELRHISAGERDYYGSVLLAGLKEYDSLISSGVLFTTNTEFNFSYLSQESFFIGIYEENFKKLTDNGGNIEAIFGYLASQAASTRTTYMDVLKELEFSVKQWHHIRELYIVSINNQRIDFLKQILINVFDKGLLSPTEHEQLFIKERNGFLKETQKLAYDYIDDLELDDFEDLEQIALDLVAAIRFRFTCAYYILNRMKNYLKQSETLTPNEAAVYASIEYIVDYLMAQTTKVSV